MRVSSALRPSSSGLPTPSPPERTTGRESRLPTRARTDATSSRRIASTSKPQRDPSGNEPGGGTASLSNVNFPRQQANARSSRKTPCPPNSRGAPAARAEAAAAAAPLERGGRAEAPAAEAPLERGGRAGAAAAEARLAEGARVEAAAGPLPVEGRRSAPFPLRCRTPRPWPC